MTPEQIRIAVAECCGWELRRTANGEVSSVWQGWITQEKDELSKPVPNRPANRDTNGNPTLWEKCEKPSHQ